MNGVARLVFLELSVIMERVNGSRFAWQPG